MGKQVAGEGKPLHRVESLGATEVLVVAEGAALCGFHLNASTTICTAGSSGLPPTLAMRRLRIFSYSPASILMGSGLAARTSRDICGYRMGCQLPCISSHEGGPSHRHRHAPPAGFNPAGQEQAPLRA